MRLIITALTILTITFTSAIQAADINVGIVDMRAIVSKSPERELILEKLRSEFSPRRDALKKLGEEIKTLAEKGQRDAPLMSQDETIALKRKIEQKQADFQLKKRALEEDSLQRESEERRKLVQSIQVAIETIAKREKLDVVLTKEITPYFSDKLDVTEKVIAYIEKK